MRLKLEKGEAVVLDLQEYRLRLSVKRTEARKLDPRWQGVTINTPAIDSRGSRTTYGALSQSDRLCASFNDDGILQVKPLSRNAS